MAIEIIMPKMGLTMESGTISSWYFKEGDAVKAGEALLSIETDKVTIDVESPGSGILLKILEPQGSSVPVAQVIGYLGEAGERVPERKSPAAQPGQPVQQPENRQAADAQPEPGKPTAISPIARKLAAQHQVDYSGIQGSGPGGRIVEADILALLKDGADQSGEPAYTKEPLSSLRLSAARRMSQSAHDAPHFYLKREIFVDNLMALREQLLPEFEKDHQLRLTYTDFLIKGTALSLREHPYLNAAWDDGALRLYQSVNLGLAISTPQGLVVAVIKDAQDKALSSISAERKELTQKAQSNRLAPQDVSAGTFTLTNLGMLGIDEFFPILNPPQSGILAVGSIIVKPVAIQHEIVLRHTLQLTLAADHRVVDGAMGAAFLGTLAHLLADEPQRLV